MDPSKEPQLSQTKCRIALPPAPANTTGLGVRLVSGTDNNDKAASQFAHLLRLVEQEHERELFSIKEKLASELQSTQQALNTLKGEQGDDLWSLHRSKDDEAKLDCHKNFFLMMKPKPAAAVARDVGAPLLDKPAGNTRTHYFSSESFQVISEDAPEKKCDIPFGGQASILPMPIDLQKSRPSGEEKASTSTNPGTSPKRSNREGSLTEKSSMTGKASGKSTVRFDSKNCAAEERKKPLSWLGSSAQVVDTRPSMESSRSAGRINGLQHHEYRLWPLWEDVLNDKSQTMKAKGAFSDSERRVDRGTWEVDSDSSDDRNCRRGRRVSIQDEVQRCCHRCLPKRPGLISHPSSSIRLLWDIIALSLVAYDVIVIPLQVFHLDDNPFLVAMMIVTMVFWTMDLTQQFFIGYHDQGIVVMDFKKIVWRYARTWMFFDCLVVAVDWTSFIRTHIGSGSDEQLKAGSYLRVTKFARFLRAARLLRLVKLKRIIHEIHDRIDSESLATYFQVLSSILCILAVNHIVACCWYGLSTWDINEGVGGTKNWVKAMQIEDTSQGYLYATSLHWSLTQFTPASMDVQPTNVVERCFTVVVVLFGLVMFSSFISSLTSAMAALRKMKYDEYRQYWLLRRYLKATGIKKSLSLRIQRYLEFVQHAQMKRLRPEDVQILRLLSAPLQNELRFAVNTRHLTSLPLFTYLGRFLYHYPQEYQRVMLKVCNDVLIAVPFAKSDTIFFCGEVTEQLLVNSRGRLNYRRQVDDDHEQVEEGRWICEPVLWVQWVHVGDLQAFDDCELLALSPHKFGLNLRSVPSISRKAANFGKRFVNDLNQTEEEDLSDINTDFFRFDRLLARKNNFVRISNLAGFNDNAEQGTKSFDARSFLPKLW